MLKTLGVISNERCEFIDITSEVVELIKSSGVNSGIAVIYTPHTTAGITINEGADPAVRSDINNFLKKLIPKLPEFSHLEGNSDSHIKSTLVGASESLIIEDGSPILGTWQSIYFAEFDGPRRRKVYVKIISG